MEQIIHNISQNLESLILVFMRVSALIFSSPIFGRRALPGAVKLGFCALIAYVVFAAYPAQPVSYQASGTTWCSSPKSWPSGWRWAT